MTYRFAASASSQAARNSSIENCVPSSGSVGLLMPPPAMILIWLAPLRTCSRTARRTSPTPSAMAPISPSPAQLQNISRVRTPLGRMSAWPPVWQTGKPAM